MSNSSKYQLKDRREQNYRFIYNETENGLGNSERKDVTLV